MERVSNRGPLDALSYQAEDPPTGGATGSYWVIIEDSSAHFLSVNGRAGVPRTFQV